MPRPESLALRVLLAVLALPLLLTACDPREAAAPGAVETEIREENGVTRVSNAGTPPRWETEPLLRIGALQGTGADVFGQVRSVVADAEGNVYVADGQAREIRVFDREGGHLRTIGREGAGPGEFGHLYSLAWIGHRLVAMDPGNSRIGLFSPEGEWIDQIAYFPLTGPANVVRLHPVRDEAFYAMIIAESGGRWPYVRFGLEGPNDTIAHPEAPDDVATGVVCHRPDGGIQSISVPEAPDLVFAFGPPAGRVAVSWTELYRIAITNAIGDTLKVISRDRSRFPFPDEPWEEAHRTYQEMRRNFPGTRCDPSNLQRPAHRAVLRHILFDTSGEMWVEAASDNGFSWDVFDPQGRLIGSAPAPERHPGIPPYVRDRILYQVETDDLDVQYVTAYRISPL